MHHHVQPEVLHHQQELSRSHQYSHCLNPVSIQPRLDQTLASRQGCLVPDNTPVYVEILAGFPASSGSGPSTGGLTRRFYGVIDLYSPDNLDKAKVKLPLGGCSALYG